MIVGLIIKIWYLLKSVFLVFAKNHENCHFRISIKFGWWKMFAKSQESCQFWIFKFQLYKFWNLDSVGVNKKYFSENSILRNLPSGQNMRTSVVGQINSSVKCVWAAYFWALVGRKCAPLESRKTWAHPGTLTFFCKQPQKL